MALLINGISYLTATEAAGILVTTSTRILMLLKNKTLEGILKDNEWFVTGDSVTCFKSHGKNLKTVKGCVSHCSSSGCGCK